MYSGQGSSADSLENAYTTQQQTPYFMEAVHQVNIL
jgi:hypothetical protein